MQKHIHISFIIILLFPTFIFLESCQRPVTQVNKVPKKVEVADEYLSKQSVEITNENINGKSGRLKRSSKRSQKQQQDLNELNKSPYKVKTKKTNDRVYDIY